MIICSDMKATNMKWLTFLIPCALLISNCFGDFFSDLDKLEDVDAKLMEIDKMMKNMETNEKDALKKITGEKEKPDVLEGLENSIGDLLTGECVFSCPNGAVPKAKKGHTPSSNGCGSYGFNLDVDGLPELTSCCDTHDKCYDTCNSNREKCDSDFKKCLMRMCKDLKSSLTKEEYAGCKSTSELMHTGMIALGCSAYKSAQTNACTCSETLENNMGKDNHSGPKVPGKKAQHAENVQKKQAETAKKLKEIQDKKKEKGKLKEEQRKQAKKGLKDEL